MVSARLSRGRHTEAQRKPERKSFSKELVHQVNHSNGPEVKEGLNVDMFGEEGDIRLVEIWKPRGLRK
jgi:hypothetical protein